MGQAPNFPTRSTDGDADRGDSAAVNAAGTGDVPCDEQLGRWIALARDGSSEAQGQVLDACRLYLLKLANRDLGSELGGKLGASDLVQETLLEAQNQIGEFRGASEADLLAWLRQILNHNLQDIRRRYFRAEKRRIDREQPLSDGSGMRDALADSTDSPSVLVSNDEQAQRLCQALTCLREDYRQVIQMRNWQLMSFSEIGSRLNRSEDAARKLWVRALEQLRSGLAEGDGAN